MVQAHVLIVDDSEIVREGLQMWLTAGGHRVTAAAGGAEALDYLRTIAFDLVILDVDMPGLSGFDTLRAVRRQKLCADTPIIMLTASDFTDDIVMSRDLGAAGYLTKPFSPESLLDKIERVVGVRDTRWIDDFHVVVDTADQSAQRRAG